MESVLDYTPILIGAVSLVAARYRHCKHPSGWLVCLIIGLAAGLLYQLGVRSLMWKTWKDIVLGLFDKELYAVTLGILGLVATVFQSAGLLWFCLAGICRGDSESPRIARR